MSQTIKQYNKLVRDKIPAIIEKNGAVAVTRILSDEEYKDYLEKKLSEEISELSESRTDAERLEELADVYEVLSALATAHGYTMQTVEAKAREKAEARGGFEDKILLVQTVENA